MRLKSPKPLKQQEETAAKPYWPPGLCEIEPLPEFIFKNYPDIEYYHMYRNSNAGQVNANRDVENELIYTAKYDAVSYFIQTWNESRYRTMY